MIRWGMVVIALVLASCGSSDGRTALEAARAHLRAGDLAAAEAAAERAAASDDALDPWRAFVRGNAAFARSVSLDEEVSRPNADPRARTTALSFAEDALAYWRAAASSRRDWPAARRNAERALIRIDKLREQGREKRKKAPEQKKEDDPEPKPARVEMQELPPSQVMALLELLQAKEQQKRKDRRDQRRAASARVERDW